MRKIAIELSHDSVAKALEELKRYKKDIRPKLDEICRRLAEIGAEKAREIIAEAKANVDEGNDDAEVFVQKIPDGYKIVAQGSDIYFIEFGTGNSAGMFYGKPLPQTSVPVYPGSYSEQHSGMYAKYGYWFYRGNIMSSTDVYMPMYHAEQVIREQERKIAQEVFSK